MTYFLTLQPKDLCHWDLLFVTHRMTWIILTSTQSQTEDKMQCVCSQAPLLSNTQESTGPVYGQRLLSCLSNLK